jgi:hypothetical protein
MPAEGVLDATPPHLARPSVSIGQASSVAVKVINDYARW